MAISKTDMHKEYERYAALCLKMDGCDARSGDLAPSSARWRPNG